MMRGRNDQNKNIGHWKGEKQSNWGDHFYFWIFIREYGIFNLNGIDEYFAPISTAIYRGAYLAETPNQTLKFSGPNPLSNDFFCAHGWSL